MIDEIITTACCHYGVTREDILSERQDRVTAHARQFCFWAIKQRSRISLLAIGRYFMRDHTTVAYGIRRYTERLEDGIETPPAGYEVLTPEQDERAVRAAVAADAVWMKYRDKLIQEILDARPEL